MKKQTNADLIEKLCSSKSSDRQEAMMYFYEQKYDQVERYVLKNSGRLTEVEDVFQDSLIALLKHANDGRLQEMAQVEAYFFTICKNHWLKALQKKGKTVELTDNTVIIETDNQESLMVTEEKKNLLDQLIGQLGSNCYQLLKYFYFEKKRMLEISSLLDLSNEQAAKDKKSSCMKKLRQLVHSSPHILEMLK